MTPEELHERHAQLLVDALNRGLGVIEAEKQALAVMFSQVGGEPLRRDMAPETAARLVHRVRHLMAPLDKHLIFPLYATRQLVATVLEAAGVTVNGRLASDAMEVQLRVPKGELPAGPLTKRDEAWAVREANTVVRCMNTLTSTGELHPTLEECLFDGETVDVKTHAEAERWQKLMRSLLVRVLLRARREAMNVLSGARKASRDE